MKPGVCSMTPRDLAFAILVVAVWGATFTVIKIGLQGVPSMLLASLRYLATAIPAVLFVPRPKVAAPYWIAYGFTVGVGQFGALFYAMELGMPAGLASVVLQSQAFFTLILAYGFLRERITGTQLAGMGAAGLGLCVIAFSLGDFGSTKIPIAALLLTLLGAAFWGMSNIVVRQAARAAASQGRSLDMLSLVVWSALVPPVPLFILALVLHEPQTVFEAFRGIDAPSIFSVAYIAYAATLIGNVQWSKLLSRYPASVVAPFSLLVPVTGLLTAGLVLSERMTLMQWLGSACVVVGLLFSTMSYRSSSKSPPSPHSHPR